VDEQYLKAMHPVTAVLHWKILSILKQYDIKTVLDVGGIGKLDKLSDYDVTNANIIDGINGCNLPYEDASFDAVVSIATLEHVKDKIEFLQECQRVTKILVLHWYPFGEWAEDVERLKKKYGHHHPCVLPNGFYTEHGIESFMNCGEHLLLCMTLTPSLKAPEVYDFITKNYDRPYGALLMRACVEGNK